MRLLARIVLASAAVAALVVPAAATGQGGPAPTLREEADSSFPDKIYTVQLPRKTTLVGRQVVVTENGVAVSGLSVSAPGGKASGAVLLIDASNSMRGAPITGAMAAAREFLRQRTPDLPVAVIAYNPEVTVLTDFTTNEAELSASVAKTPELAEGTHIYDALTEAAELAKDAGLERTTAILLSDGNRRGVQTSLPDTLEALDEANVRVIAVGLRSPLYDESTLTTLAQRTGGGYVGTHTPDELAAIFGEISTRISREYLISYRSLLPPQQKAQVRAVITGFPAATATYTTPAIDFSPQGTFEQSWIDRVIVSPYLAVFVVVAVLALIAFAILTAVDVRNRSLRRRMAMYVSVPTEEESKLRRAEVAALLAGQAQRTVGGQRWWQSFERDVELARFKVSALTIAGWTVLGGILASLVVALALQSLWGLLAGLAAPLVTRIVVSQRVRRVRNAFAEQLPDNLEVLAGALRAGHSLIGAMGVMVDDADEPSKTEFRRVLQDEQLGVPMDEALMVMAQRMENREVDQVAIVTRLQREAGGNTAEVLDRVVENIRGRMEIHRLIRVLTAQGRLARWVLTAMPLFMIAAIQLINPRHLEPLFGTNLGRGFLVLWLVMMVAGWYSIKKIVELDV
jgi:tight adherence protein B